MAYVVRHGEASWPNKLATFIDGAWNRIQAKPHSHKWLSLISIHGARQLPSKVEYCHDQVTWEGSGVNIHSLKVSPVTMLVTMAVNFSPRAACESAYIVNEHSTPFSISKCTHILSLHCFRSSHPLQHPQTGVTLF